MMKLIQRTLVLVSCSGVLFAASGYKPPVGTLDKHSSFSSPEGTVTTFVEKSRVLVYAPRAARAQKVIFDTPERQLIYEPDTPFRSFFDSRSPDFADGKVDYAKSTILKDVVNMLRNKEYIRIMVEEVVSRHETTAISSNSPCVITREIEKWIETLKSVQELSERGKSDDARRILEQFLGENSSSLDQIGESTNFLTGESRRNFSNFYHRLEELRPHPNQPSRQEASHGPIPERLQPSVSTPNEQNFRQKLDDMLRQKPLKDLDAVLKDLAGYCQLAPNDGEWRARHKKILIDSIYQEVMNEYYPDMRDEDIDRIFYHFKYGSDDLKYGSRDFTAQDRRKDLNEVWRFAIADGAALTADAALILDLKQTLKEKSYLKSVIQKAIEKRANLFRSGASPTAGLEQFKSELGAFLREPIQVEGLLAAFQNAKDSLWGAFIDGLNSGSDARVLSINNWTEAGDRALTPAELSTFSKEFRNTLLKNWLSEQPNPKIESATPIIHSFFSTRTNYLRSTFKTGTNIAALRSQQIGAWIESVTNDVRVRKTFEAWNATNKTAGATQTQKDNAKGAFLLQLQRSMTNHLADIPTDKQISLPVLMVQVLEGIDLQPAPQDDKLKEFLLAVFPREIELETSSARAELVRRFKAVFGSYPMMIKSDLPIFQAFVEQSRFNFTDPTFRAKVKTDLIRPFGPLWKTNAPATADATLDQISARIETPDYSYLFGPGLQNAGVIEAFKTEFYNAFKHRLGEALAAEQEADYDYWWLTFYPKAIPLGARKLEGESIIEVAFPQSIVPEQQFHRWLQDRGLQESSGSICTSKSSAEKIQLATTILRDFMTVLENPWFGRYYSNLRSQLLDVLNAFEPSRSANGAECLDLKQGLRTMLLHTKIDQAELPRELFECTCQKPKQSPPKTKSIATPREKSQAMQIASDALEVGHQALNSSITSSNRLNGLYQALLRAPTDEAKRISSAALTQKVSRFFAECIRYLSNPDVETLNYLSVSRTELRDLLVEEPLGMLHVAFAVLSGLVTEAPLPEKVNLYSYAYLDLEQTLQVPYDRDHPLYDSAMKYPMELRNIIVNAYFSSYPGVPDREQIKNTFFQEPLSAYVLMFRWLHEIAPRELTSRFPSPNARRVMTRKFLDEFKVFSPEAFRKVNSQLATNGSPSAIFDTIIEDQQMVDQLSARLFDFYYEELFRSMDQLSQVNRHPVPFENIGSAHFHDFRRWSKPHYQPGIQIVDMLPASRDDLVAMSISEGGVVAKAAAQAETSAAYDLNKLQMATRALQMLGSQGETNVLSQAAAEGTPDISARSQRLENLSKLRQGGELGGFSLGAAAQGSVYGRARAALSYSRRREYLNAAITAAGRGDNFAKWVVRKSDLRSPLASPANRRLTAAAHTGYPNGDQPFHLLVKIPRRSTFTDWSGKRHIYFNSAYAATRKVSWWKVAGHPGLLAKTPFALINPRWWNTVEQDLVGTAYPFKWNVDEASEQLDLLRTPNTLGGQIWLDEMDKIKHSEVLALLEAEDNFIRLTREAQSREIGVALQQLDEENKSFQQNVRSSLDQAISSQIGRMSNANSRAFPSAAPP
jgi:hypothetical protein